jgi:hypothetical protein
MVLGNILCDFFTNSSGRPGRERGSGRKERLRVPIETAAEAALQLKLAFSQIQAGILHNWS